MKTFTTILAFLSLNLLISQTTITQWTFEGDVSTPSTGNGTATLLGTTATFENGTGGSGTSSWNTSNYPAQSTASGERGVQFAVSTVGYENINLSFDHRASVNASRWAQVDYSLDGGSSWEVGFWNNGGDLSPHNNFYPFSVDFSSVTGAENNPNFMIRIVSIFSPLAFNQNSTLSYGPNEAYMRAVSAAKYQPTPGQGTENYGTSGTWRFDNVTFTGSVIMPVTFLDITAFNEGSVNKINFSTASEENNAYFTIERSTDGKEFISIGKVNGAGNSSVIRKYQFTDNKPLFGVNYYRIKQTDIDLSFAYSKTVSTLNTNYSDLRVVNTVINEVLNVIGDNNDCNILIHNSFGKLIKILPIKNGINQINLTDIQRGTYFITANGHLLDRIVKL